MMRYWAHTLTIRQAQVLSFIRDSVAANGYPPTIRELVDHFGWHSTNAANDHVLALIRKGCLVRAGAAHGRGSPVRTLRLVVPEAGPARVDLASAVFACEVGGRFVSHEGVAYRVTGAQHAGQKGNE